MGQRKSDTVLVWAVVSTGPRTIHTPAVRSVRPYKGLASILARSLAILRANAGATMSVCRSVMDLDCDVLQPSVT